METLNSISILDYESLKKMLLSVDDDDKSIAFSNIKNLNLEPIFIVLLAKQCKLEHRNKMIEEFHDVFNLKILSSLSKVIHNPWSISNSNKKIIDLSWENIYDLINNYYYDNDLAKKIFENEFKKESLMQVFKSTTWNFITDLDCKIKW